MTEGQFTATIVTSNCQWSSNNQANFSINGTASLQNLQLVGLNQQSCNLQVIINSNFVNATKYNQQSAFNLTQSICSPLLDGCPTGQVVVNQTGFSTCQGLILIWI